MTAETVPPSDARLENDSWDALPPSEPVELPVARHLPPDQTEEVPAGICRVCGDPIVREPGARGRMPKTHPDCRTLRVAGNATTVRSTKKDREAEQAVLGVKKWVVKGAFMLAAIDPYDSFCLMSGWTDVEPQLKAVLVKHDRLRADLLAVGEGGSIIGLALSVVVMAIPMLAHHGIIRFKQDRIQNLLLELPKTLYKLRLRLAEGEASVTKMMAEHMEAFQAEKRQAQQQQRQAASEKEREGVA